MRDSAGSGHRRLLIAGGGALALLIALASLVPRPQPSLGYPSTYSVASDGAKAAFLLIGELGFPIERWQQPASQLPTGLEANGTLFVVAEPLLGPTERDAAHVLRFLEAGGTVLAIGAGTAMDFIPGAEADEDEFSTTAVEYNAVNSEPLTRGAPVIRMAPVAEWTTRLRGQAVHYRYGSEAGIVSYPYGAGSVIWWAAATPISNIELADGHHLQLLLNVLGPRTRRVPRDEYSHGQARSLWNSIAQTPLPWALAQLGVFALTILITYSRRHGPIHEAVAVSRLSPTEFVETMGDLYRQAGAASIAVEVGGQTLRARLVRQLGLPPSTRSEQIGRTLALRSGARGEAVGQWLERCEGAGRIPGLSDQQALEILQGAHRAYEELNARPSAGLKARATGTAVSK